LIFIEVEDNFSEFFYCEEVLQKTVEVACVADVLKSGRPVYADRSFPWSLKHL